VVRVPILCHCVRFWSHRIFGVACSADRAASVMSCVSGTATAGLPGPTVGSSFPAVCLASFVSMVSIRALRFVLEFVGEKHMRNWLTAHVRLGRLSWQGSEVFPPGEAAELNARLENLEDEVRVQREQQEEDDQTMAGLQWLIDHQDLFDQPDDV